VSDVVPEGRRGAAALGAYRLTIPREPGGWGLTVPGYLPYLEAAAAGHGSGRMLVHLTNGVCRPVPRFGNPSNANWYAELSA
jgi:alkylation response protein AidB-like acyl-CoA dehydrogenase